MKVKVISKTSKKTQYDVVVTTVTVENPNGKTQYFQLAPWNYKAAGLEGVMHNANNAIEGTSYDIAFKSAKIKGRNVTMLTKFSTISAENSFVWDDGSEPTPQTVVETPVVTPSKINTVSEPSPYDNVVVPLDAYNDLPQYEDEPEYDEYGNIIYSEENTNKVITKEPEPAYDDIDLDGVPF